MARPTVIALGLALGVMVSACGSPAAVSDADRTLGSIDADADTDRAPAEVVFQEARGAVVANSAGTVTTTGLQRVMTAVLGPETMPFLGGPEIPVTITFEAVDAEHVGQAEGTWLTTSASPLGLYVSYFEFPSAGQWEVAVSAGGSEVGRTGITVTAQSSVPKIGDPAPATASPTADTAAEIALISTDQDPDPDFYDLSIAEAVGNGRPTVIAFVTPAFCQTALCGPTLEAVKGATAGRDGIDVVHVEPFDLESAAAGELLPISSMEVWGLRTEPWVFIVGADGAISATFEGIIGQNELEEALERL